MELTTARWDGAQLSTQVVDSPSPAQISDSVRELDGWEVNDLYLYGEDGWWLAVCGGPLDFLISLNNEELGEYWVVTRGGSGDRVFEVVCGGQRSSFPASHRATVVDAVAAATAFSVSGERAASLDWARA